MRRDVGGFRLALTRRPQQLAVAITGIPIPRDLVSDIFGIETAEQAGDKEGALLARCAEITEHALADSGHVIDPGMKQRIVGPVEIERPDHGAPCPVRLGDDGILGTSTHWPFEPIRTR
jgi:hypothetical protein